MGFFTDQVGVLCKIWILRIPSGCPSEFTRGDGDRSERSAQFMSRTGSQRGQGGETFIADHRLTCESEFQATLD